MKLKIREKGVTQEEFVQYILGCYDMAGREHGYCALSAVWATDGGDYHVSLTDTALRFFGWTETEAFAFMGGFDTAKHARACNYVNPGDNTGDYCNELHPDFHELGKQTHAAVRL